jgi:hypothetical protein
MRCCRSAHTSSPGAPRMRKSAPVCREMSRTPAPRFGRRGRSPSGERRRKSGPGCCRWVILKPGFTGMISWKTWGADAGCATLIFIAALASILLRPLTGEGWLVTRYAPVSTWAGALLELLVLWALFKAFRKPAAEIRIRLSGEQPRVRQARPHGRVKTMRGMFKNKFFSCAIALFAGMAAYTLFLRKRLLQWGATREEVRRPFPGDSLVSDPNYQSTRAILIHAAPEDVWPWIVQIGYQRGGFYSYDWLERKAGLKGLHSTDQVVPAWQEIQPGDSVSISPVTPLEVAELEPGRALVLHAVMSPFTARIVDRTLQPEAAYMDWSWAFVLEPAGPAVTRLLVRVRANIQPQPLGRMLSWLAIEPIHTLMERKMLQGIRARAEANRSNPLLLDEFLPKYDFTEVHRLTVRASREEVYRAVKELRPAELSPLIYAMLDMRRLPALLARKGSYRDNLPDSKTFLEQLYAGGFIPLTEDAERGEVVFGLIGQFWKLSGGENVRVADPDAFRTFQVPNYAKVAANLVVQELGNECLLSTETRIWAPNAETRRKFASYWKIISMGSGWIRILWLKAIKRKAERENYG